MNDVPCNLNFLYDNLDEESEQFVSRRKHSNSFNMKRSRVDVGAYEVVASPTLRRQVNEKSSENRAFEIVP